MTRRPSTGAARRGKCPRCARPVLRQTVGRTAALEVTADDQPLTAAEATALRTDNRLPWCVRETKNGPDLRWATRDHPADCPHPHVVDHVCTGPKVPPPARQAHRPRRPTPVPDGQLTL